MEKRAPHVLLAGVAATEAILIGLVASSLLRHDVATPAPPSSSRSAAESAGASPPAEISPPVEAAPAPTTAEGAAARPTTGPALLFGTVTGPDGRPLERSTYASLSVHAGSAPRALVQASLWGRDAFAIPGLEAGSYLLRLRATGYRDVEREIAIPPGVGRLRHDVRLQRTWQLRVLIVTPEGEPVRDRLRERTGNTRFLLGAPTAIATPEPPPALLPLTDSRNAEFGVGRWVSSEEFGGRAGRRLPKRYAGYLDLPEDVPLHVSAVMRTAVLATERVQAGQPEVKLVVPMDRLLANLCTVRLRVVDGASRQPIAAARAGLSDAQSSGSGQPVDAEGRVELRDEQPGLANLDVTAKDRALPWWNVELVPGGTVDLGDVSLLPPVALELRLAGCAAGTEISVSLRTLEPPSHAALRPRWAHFGSRKDGEFSAQVAPGRYLLRAMGGQRIAFLAVDTHALGKDPLVVRLEPDAKLRVLTATGRPFELTLFDRAGRALWQRWVQAVRPFELPLPPGEYAAEIRNPDGTSQRRSISLPPGGAELDLR